MDTVIKLSSPATREFWEVPVVYEDEHLLGLSKPPCLLTSPDRDDPLRPNLMKLLHAGIAENKPWARQRGLSYLMHAHRLDFETSGVLLLARSKPVLVALANLFGSEKPLKTCVTLVHGSPGAEAFEVDAPVGTNPVRPGVMRIDRQEGKRARTRFEVAERFRRYTLLRCYPLTERTHQIRVHLRSVRLPIAGDSVYGGRPLLLSRLKPDYSLKVGKTERPLISTVALHAERLELQHPVTGQTVVMTAEWPKDLLVAIKYLRRYAQLGGQADNAQTDMQPPEPADLAGAAGLDPE